MKNFEYKELDMEGMETLKVISGAERFNNWMYETIRKYVDTGSVLEIGSGIGNISKFFLHENFDISLSDIRLDYCDYLSKRFERYENLNDVIRLDIVDAEFDIKYEKYLNHFDRIFSLNVIEHIKNDSLAIHNCKKLLRKNGRLIILAPAFQFLYNGFDERLNHYRRYSVHTLSKVFIKNNLVIRKAFYYNCMGMLGWFVSGKLLYNKTIPQGQMNIYDIMTPFFKLIDKTVFNQVGLSVIVVGE